MPRKQRVWYPGAVLHIANRGNRKLPIFHDEKDYMQFLQLMETARQRHPFYLHAYCIMSNHYHLLLEAIDESPALAMHFLNVSYAKYYNDRYLQSGHVFQGRYYSKLAPAIDYILDASKYIHLNPVEAGITRNPADYRWSSCAAYIFHTENPHITTSTVLSYFPKPSSYHYQKFLQSDRPSKFQDLVFPVVQYSNKSTNI
ncbi:transposase [Alkalihalobacterium sp. APHAB7]|uniref:transposase n=1 Tax=Alkalihalobacterium sp. APHAB7 TaxID=3402081 RepID=UPI003AABA661